MSEYLVVEFNNIEPLKIGAGGNKTNQTEPSKDYIPGSTIRGAMIGALIRKGKFENKQKDILTKMKCLNAYPYKKTDKSHGELYIPTPYHLRMNKHTWRRLKGDENSKSCDLNNLLGVKLQIKDKKKEAKNVLEYKFIAIKDNKLVGTKVQKEYRLHHTKRELKEEENLFRYQAISIKQRFRSIIKFDKELEKEIKDVLQEGARFYLGGSKGSGYGLCEVSYVSKVKDNYNEAKEKLGLEYQYTDDDFLTITCLSDCICRNEYGQPVNYIPEKYIEKICGLKVRLCKNKQIQSSVTEGYNTKWRARYPKETTIKAGSVLQYEYLIGQKEIDVNNAISVLEKELVGFRTEDGFGWIGVNIKFPQQIFLRENNYKDKNAEAKDILILEKENKKIKDVAKIIFNGFGETAKKSWLRMIYIKSNENVGEKSFVISNELKTYHITRFMKEVEAIIKEQKEGISQEKKYFIKHDYANNKDKFSLAGLNFNQIIDYLKNIKAEVDYKQLEEYADCKLNTQKGKVFYLGFQDAKRVFIAELLSEGLYIQHRRKKDEQNS